MVHCEQDDQLFAAIRQRNAAGSGTDFIQIRAAAGRRASVAAHRAVACDLVGTRAIRHRDAALVRRADAASAQHCLPDAEHGLRAWPARSMVHIR